ncbi:hypothetical protein BJX66DRAFT_345612 [Aspergillus keveii]|uniref:Zn(2)-C6 fungal-type domain-containing protein n=1 Tax=Aspergillus keveii TaxID=714993 RepID=A0ABR4FHG6_9EURO
MDILSGKHARHTRVHQACERCRRKRDKCDARRPICSACKTSSVACTYSSSDKKRGLPVGYVAALEKILALAICKFENFEEAMLSVLGATPDSPGPTKGRLNRPKALRWFWKDSSIYSILADPASGISRMLLAADDEGLVAERMLDVHCKVYTVNSASSQPSGGASSSPATPTLSTLAMGAIGGELCLPQLPASVFSLIDRYFATTHPWLPFMDKQAMTRAVHLYAPVPYSGAADYAALWALLSYTASQSNTRSDEGKPTNAREYYHIAQAFIPPSLDSLCQLPHLQALLLLLLVDIAFQDWSAVRLLRKKAVDLACFMGDNLAAGQPDDRHWGERVLMACSVIDSSIAFRLSENPYQKSSSAMRHVKEDGVEEWCPWPDVLPSLPDIPSEHRPRNGPLHSLQCYNHLFQLSIFMNKSTRAIASGANRVPTIKELIGELERWDQLLPLSCQLLGPGSIYPERHSALLPQQTYIVLAYIAILLRLYVWIAPHELRRSQSLSPSLEGAKKLLYRAPMIASTHLYNFSSCAIPPVFVLCLQCIVHQAAVVRNIQPDSSFPFTAWAEMLRQRILDMCPALPVYQVLTKSIEQCFLSSDPVEQPPLPRTILDMDNIPATPGPSRLQVNLGPPTATGTAWEIPSDVADFFTRNLGMD